MADYYPTGVFDPTLQGSIQRMVRGARAGGQYRGYLAYGKMYPLVRSPTTTTKLRVKALF